MPRFRNDARRCPGCRLHRQVCICDRFVALPTRTRVVLLLHQLEARKPTNTGRFALRCLPNSELAVRGRLDDAEEQARATGEPQPPAAREVPRWLARAAQPVLLFPHPEAVALTTFVDSSLPTTLVVPDGTWSQAVRARRRVPGLADVPCACLPAGLVSTYRLRHEPRPGRVSTLEAIAHALGILEGPAIAEALLEIHRIAVERTLWTKGRLARDLVAGGIPALASRHDPRGDA
jgi:DTW domain-containing protein